MVAVPAATPVTKPVLLTVAIAVLDDTQGFVLAAVAEPVSWVVELMQTLVVPVMVGKAFTVMVACFVQPLLLV